LSGRFGSFRCLSLSATVAAVVLAGTGLVVASRSATAPAVATPVEGPARASTSAFTCARLLPAGLATVASSVLAGGAGDRAAARVALRRAVPPGKLCSGRAGAALVKLGIAAVSTARSGVPGRSHIGTVEQALGTRTVDPCAPGDGSTPSGWASAPRGGQLWERCDPTSSRSTNVREQARSGV
jgi:hypothetical protein